MQLAEIHALLTAWAAKEPLVGRLWLFGSRAREQHRPDSDVDVAIELDMSAVKGVDESGGMATWAFDAKPWKPELEDLLSLIVDLQRYKAGETRIVQAGLDQSSILVYEKQKREILVWKDDMMSLLKMFGLGPKERICAGCGEKRILRDRKQPNPRHLDSTRYWGQCSQLNAPL